MGAGTTEEPTSYYCSYPAWPYIDLNPVRADIFNTPESSSYTSFREWLESRFALHQAIDDQTEIGVLFDFKTPLKPLFPFENRLIDKPQVGILFNDEKYLSLVDWTGRIIRSNKHGHIEVHQSPIVSRLNIDTMETPWRHHGTHTLWLTIWCFSRSRLRHISPLFLWLASLAYILWPEWS